ncbi:MAG: SEC-C metal-binding domain-containing protein [Solirubrobacteraceae bacterium]
MAHDWMCELPWTLARRGMFDDALRIADVFAELDTDHRSVYANNAAVISAEAGRAADARSRIDATCARSPATSGHVRAGDVHRSLADPEAAQAALAAELGQRIAPKTGRNEPCPCGSGRKYKKCCGA